MLTLILCRVNTQRRHYKLMKEGKPSCMNDERVRILEDEGFAWSTSTNAPGSAIKRLNNAMRHNPDSDGVRESSSRNIPEPNSKPMQVQSRPRTHPQKKSGNSAPNRSGVNGNAAMASSQQVPGMLSSLSEAASVIASMQGNTTK